MNRARLLRQSIQDKNCVKIIAGIDNFDIEKVEKVLIAAEKGGADAVDVAARADIIKRARELTSLPVFVSSINPEELLMAKENGADALEVGNFDALYKKGLRISAQEVLEITQDTLELVGNDIFVCVTVPGHLEVSEQIELVQKLEELGIDLIQTEGAATVNVQTDGARGLLEKANVSIANSIELIRNTEIPVMTASGISSTTAKMAFAAGASAIGVGSAVNKLNSEIEMIASVRSIVESVNAGKKTEEKIFF